jgi:hypothetical protein
VTDILGVQIETLQHMIDGFLIADKVGEIKFFNINHFNKEAENENKDKVIVGH